jgi:hypothetical protein
MDMHMKNTLFKRKLLKRNPVLVTPSEARCSVLHDLIAPNFVYSLTGSECVMSIGLLVSIAFCLLLLTAL